MIKLVVGYGTAVTVAAACWLVAAQRLHGVEAGTAAPVAAVGRGAPSAPRSTVARRVMTVRSRDVPDTRPRRDPCAGVRDRTVLVSLSAQRLWLCDGRTVDADFAVTTGRHAHGDRTPTGTYDVQARTRDTTLDPSTGSTYHVKYWLPFKWGVYGFHDAPWQTIPFGSQQYRADGSDGCVHMREPDIKRMFGWVRLGTPVKIQV